MLPDIGVANGIMSVILNFAKAMPQDIQFDIVYFHETENTRQKEIEALGGRVYKISKPSPKSVASGELRLFFDDHRGEWEALHIHAPHFAVFIAPAAKRAGLRKICVHCHSTEYSLKGNAKRNELLSLYAKYFVKDKFACSELAGDFWYGKQPYTVVNNAIDCQAFAFNQSIRDDKRKVMNLQDALVVSHIGRTDIPQKNHPFMLRIFAEILKQEPKAVLLLIGAEPTPLLSQLCEQLGVSDRVQFLGLRSDVSELLQASDVFLFPSTREGLPVSVIEAQAAGLPVQMSDSVSHEAVVTDLVQEEALSTLPETWARQCIRLGATKHVNTLTAMQAAGWDLNSVSAVLCDYYQS
ncbi:MAG: glycosyltransferase [Eubacterium sp.]|nr:glycosyltransferase [Eubacterium sp.]